MVSGRCFAERRAIESGDCRPVTQLVRAFDFPSALI